MPAKPKTVTEEEEIDLTTSYLEFSVVKRLVDRFSKLDRPYILFREGDPNWGEHTTLTFCGDRPETPEEKKKRLAKSRKEAAARKEARLQREREQEEKERAIYLKLKEKFEGRECCGEVI